MKTFKDTADRDWTIAINITSVKRVRDLAGIDLLANVGGELVEKLNGDALVVFDILYALVKPEAETRSVTAEQFGSALDGDVIEAATTALIAELIAFFPPSRRPMIVKAMAKLKDLETAAMAQVLKEIDEMNAESLVASLSNSKSGNSPASSESIPAR